MRPFGCALLAVSLLGLPAACGSGASDESAGIVAEPVTPGPCATACGLAATGDCDWQSQCDEEYGGGGMGALQAYCGEKFLMCEAAESAATGTAFGLSWCWRSCEGFHSR